MTTEPKLSVVVPVHNERDNVSSLLLEIEAALTPLNIEWEALFVDDCSRDDTLAVLRGLRDVRLEIQPGGDLRLLALESDGISVRRIAAGTGQVLWRTGRPQMERECAALNGGNR